MSWLNIFNLYEIMIYRRNEQTLACVSFIMLLALWA